MIEMYMKNTSMDMQEGPAIFLITIFLIMYAQDVFSFALICFIAISWLVYIWAITFKTVLVVSVKTFKVTQKNIFK